MHLIDALISRRSHQVLGEPAPGDESLLKMIEVAAAAPDHGRLRPWRLVVHRGRSREELGEALAAGSPAPERDRLKPLRAPLLLSIVFCPVHDAKVPRWEQLASVAGVVYGVSLALHSQGWASIWRTGARLMDPAVREFLGLTEDEELLGWLYVGRPSPESAVKPRPPIDVSRKVSFHERAVHR